MAYKPPTEYIFLDQKRALKIVKQVRKIITKFGLTKEDIGFTTN